MIDACQLGLVYQHVGRFRFLRLSRTFRHRSKKAAGPKAIRSRGRFEFYLPNSQATYFLMVMPAALAI